MASSITDRETDLSRTEHIEQAQKRNLRIKASAVLPKTNDALTEPLEIPGIIYHNINFNGSAFSRMLLSQLSWLEFFKLIGLMMLGLIGLAQSSLDVCTGEVRQVFDVLSDERNWPVLIHCTQGKDRTGLVVMLVLFLLGVGDEIIDDDYRLSESELAPEKEERLKEIASIGLSERFAVCPPDVVSGIHAHVKDKYTSVENYLGFVGVSSDQVSFIKTKLLATSSDSQK
ncbi:hypothetical protein IAQ61_001770 [Plenodomus lingam]|uniref:uncharacterized protein n=1 Tax=Leptosphaeria maculans TaxID=5022 RepID=UPI003324BF8E|nr:hypothetical protein IAQ61_001770 [Plenodomus lingam]